MSGDKHYQPPQNSLMSELKRLLSSLVAFAAATVLLAIQGSIEPHGLIGFLGLGIFVAAIPLGIFSYILFHKVLESDPAPPVVYKAADVISTLALVGLCAGFIFLLADFSPLLCGILVFSLLMNFLVFRWVIGFWEKSRVEENAQKQKDVA
ncbi:hypothetical protein [Marinobacter sp. DUT-1]|uniref:hypothetical protein n=1 Tax=Marinobacter sp. DUT-1 TaxID=3412037 RepID=UPI003D17F59B